MSDGWGSLRVLLSPVAAPAQEVLVGAVNARRKEEAGAWWGPPPIICSPAAKQPESQPVSRPLSRGSGRTGGPRYAADAGGDTLQRVAPEGPQLAKHVWA